MEETGLSIDMTHSRDGEDLTTVTGDLPEVKPVLLFKRTSSEIDITTVGPMSPHVDVLGQWLPSNVEVNGETLLHAGSQLPDGAQFYVQSIPVCGWARETSSTPAPVSLELLKKGHGQLMQASAQKELGVLSTVVAEKTAPMETDVPAIGTQQHTSSIEVADKRPQQPGLQIFTTAADQAWPTEVTGVPAIEPEPMQVPMLEPEQITPMSLVMKTDEITPKKRELFAIDHDDTTPTEMLSVTCSEVRCFDAPSVPRKVFAEEKSSQTEITLENYDVMAEVLKAQLGMFDQNQHQLVETNEDDEDAIIDVEN